MIGFKIMGWDPATREIVSLADARQRWPLVVGEVVTARSPGLFLSPNREYVVRYYASGGDAKEVILAFDFDPNDITRGNLADREPEIAVRRARLVDYEVLGGDIFLPTENETIALRRIAKAKRGVPLFVVAGNSATDPPRSTNSKWAPESVTGGIDERERYVRAQGSTHVIVGTDWLRDWRKAGTPRGARDVRSRTLAHARVLDVNARSRRDPMRDVGDIVPIRTDDGRQIRGEVVEVTADVILVQGEDGTVYRIPTRFDRMLAPPRPRDDEDIEEDEQALKARLKAERAGRRGASYAKRESVTEQASARLAVSAFLDRVHPSRIVLDPRLLLGDLLTGSADSVVFLTGQDAIPIAIPRRTLVRARSALRPFTRELSSWVDTRGLHFRWRGGRGGLELRSISPKSIDVLTMVDLRRFPVIESFEGRDPARRYWTERELFASAWESP